MHIIGLIFLGICVAFFLTKMVSGIEISEYGTPYEESGKKSRSSIEGDIIDVEPIDEDSDK